LAYNNRGVVYINKGKTALACADLHKAKELGDKDAAAMIEFHCK